MKFTDRAEAGRRLAEALSKFKGQDVVVYGLVRGGVIPAAEIAKALNAPLEILIPRKIGHPYQPEYAIGAVAEDGHLVLNEEEAASVDPAWLDAEIARQRAEARRRREKYLQDRTPVPVEGKTAILVDDGIATGLTMRLSIKEVRHRKPKQIVVAVPVIPYETARWLQTEAEEVVALDIPESFLGAVGAYYQDFFPVSDNEVLRAMEQAQE